MVKIGVVGLGHLGKIHLACIEKTDFEIVGCYDIDDKALNYAEKEFGIKGFESLEKLLDVCDAVDIVCSTSSHYEVAKMALERAKHVFIEKPFVEELDQGLELKSIALKNNCKVQIGHVERYNPSLRAVSDLALAPKFVEAHRLAQFNPRGNDVSVVMDLMIHDLDLLCHLIKSDVDTIEANGVNVVENSPDICNARIQFKNGAVANLTASRISMKQMRKFRMFQSDRYVSLDLLNKECQVISLSNSEKENSMSFQTALGEKYVQINAMDVEPVNAIQKQFEDFLEVITNKKEVNVGIDDALKSLSMAKMIQDSIFVNNQKLVL